MPSRILRKYQNTCFHRIRQYQAARIRVRVRRGWYSRQLALDKDIQPADTYTGTSYSCASECYPDKSNTPLRPLRDCLPTGRLRTHVPSKSGLDRSKMPEQIQATGIDRRCPLNRLLPNDKPGYARYREEDSPTHYRRRCNPHVPCPRPVRKHRVPTSATAAEGLHSLLIAN